MHTEFLFFSSCRFVLIIGCARTRKKITGTSERTRERASGRITCTHPPESPYGKHSDEPEGKPQPNTTCTHIQQWGSHPLSLAGRQVPASLAGGLGPAKSLRLRLRLSQRGNPDTHTNRQRAWFAIIAVPIRIVPEAGTARGIARCARHQDMDRNQARVRFASAANARQSDIRHANVNH